MSDEHDEIIIPKIRVTSADILANRQAKVFVSEFGQKLSGWQTEAAHITAFAAHERKSDGLPERRRRLLAAIKAERRKFDAAVEAMPEKLKTHSRVTDIARAMDQIAKRLS